MLLSIMKIRGVEDAVMLTAVLSLQKSEEATEELGLFVYLNYPTNEQIMAKLREIHKALPKEKRSGTFYDGKKV